MSSSIKYLSKAHLSSVYVIQIIPSAGRHRLSLNLLHLLASRAHLFSSTFQYVPNMTHSSQIPLEFLWFLGGSSSYQWSKAYFMARYSHSHIPEHSAAASRQGAGLHESKRCLIFQKRGRFLKKLGICRG